MTETEESKLSESIAQGEWRWSYTSGTSDTPLLGLTIGDLFDQTVATYPDHPALISRHQHIRLTYRELQAQVNLCAKGLMALGLQKGQRIGIWSPNRAEWCIKGATLSHHNLLNNGYFVARLQNFTPGDKLCIPVPLYHCFGMVMGTLGCVTHGAAMVYPSEGFEPLAVLQAVQEEQCTALHGVPTMFIAELDHPDFSKFDLSSLRTGVMAGSPCPVEVMKKVIDPETGKVVPIDIPGELCTRGYSVMLGYWNNPEATAQAIDWARWMHTGDQATLDAEGYINIVGRIKEMIIRGGENLYPREIEEFLSTHAKISEVQVIGVPDPKYGEEIMA